MEQPPEQLVGPVGGNGWALGDRAFQFSPGSELSYAACSIQESMATESTSLRISRSTLAELTRFQEAVQARTADETIRLLLHKRRYELISRLFGSATIDGSFEESDRVDSDR